MHQCLLRSDLLLGDRVLAEQGAVAFQVDFGVLQQGLVARELAFILHELSQQRSRIDLGQQVAGAHVLTFLESDAHQLSIHLGVYRHRVDRGDTSQPAQIDVDVARLRRGDDHGCRAVGIETLASAARLLRLCLTESHEGENRGGCQKDKG